MANFRKRESGLWQATVRMTGYPSQSKTFERKIDAEIWARKVEADIDRGIFQNSSDAEKTTLNDLIDRFKKEYAPFHYRKREDEKEAWRYQVARLDSLIGKYSLAAIDQKIVGVYRDLRLAGNKQMDPVGDSTVRKEIFMLSKLMKFAQIECGILLPRGNPVDNVRKPSEGKGRERRLTKEEFARLETEIKKSRNKLLYPAFQFAIETAARQNEILSLTWENVNLERKFVLMKETKNGEERAAPLSLKAIEVLNALPKPKQLGKVNTTDQPFPIERACLLSVFRYACQRAKIQNFTWHDLRHEAMSRLSEKNDFSILELASISGHKTLQMLKKYTHLQAEKLAEKMG
jgi:integrase